jgi:hypothetical protein
MKSVNYDVGDYLNKIKGNKRLRGTNKSAKIKEFRRLIKQMPTYTYHKPTAHVFSGMHYKIATDVQPWCTNKYEFLPMPPPKLTKTAPTLKLPKPHLIADFNAKKFPDSLYLPKGTFNNFK